MDWMQIANTVGGWGVSVGLVTEFLRRLLRGDFILKREYDDVVSRASKATTIAEESVKRQGLLSEQTITTQAELIKHLRKEDADR